MISDITCLEDLTNLEKLFLAQNKVSDISCLKGCKQLQVLSVFDNEIFHLDSTLETLESLPKLKELSIDSNPVNAKEGFKYHLVLKLKLNLLEDDKINDMDRDLAKMFYKKNGLKMPIEKKTIKTKCNLVFNLNISTLAITMKPHPDDENEESSYIVDPNKENKILKDRLKKKVTFEDLENEGVSVDEHEFKKIQTRCDILTQENQNLKYQLQQKK